jgi:hypothetical protein
MPNQHYIYFSEKLHHNNIVDIEQVYHSTGIGAMVFPIDVD